MTFGAGPLLLVAGAGTGKTRVLTERLRYLLEKKRVPPESILALTFTEKAAEEMQARLDERLPLGYQEPWLSTFHSFGQRVLEESGLEIGLDPSAKVMTEADRWLFFRRHLFDFKLNYFRPLSNPAKFIGAILTLFSRLQDEAVTPKDFLAWAKTVAKTNPNKIDPKGLPQTLRVGSRLEMKRWRELADAYEKYEQLKIKESRWDFGDLLLLVLRLFQGRPNVLKKYQEQFRYILVDEFQDTNYAQCQLLKFLAPPKNRPNLLVAADDDQAIYRFRGAAVSNVLDFKRDYPRAHVITLKDNYRTVKPILGAAYRLIQKNNPDRLEVKLKLSKKLRSRVQQTPGQHSNTLEYRTGEPLALRVAATGEDEAAWVIQKILALVQERSQRYTWKDFAILARANNHLDTFAAALRTAKIPYQLLGNRGLFDQGEVRTLIAALRVLAHPEDDVSLYHLLSSPALKISSEKLVSLLGQARQRREPLWEVIQGEKDEKVVELRELLSQTRQLAAAKPVGRFLYDFVIQSGLWQPYLNKDSLENSLPLKNINLFFNRVQQFEREDKNPTLFEFLDFLEMLLEAGENPAQAEIEDVDTVNLLTVHGAKGLEFPVVFLVNLTADRFPTRARGDPFPLPEALIRETLPEGDAHFEEERRLFYVAVTRARYLLFLTYAKSYGGLRESRPSPFIEELGIELSGYQVIRLSDTYPLLKETVTAGTKPRPLALKTVSYSQLETFAQCPLKYKYRYVLGLTGEPSHVLAFGQTIHRTLRDFHRRELGGKKGSLKNLLTLYKRHFLGEGYLNAEHRQERYRQGQKLLRAYFRKHRQLLSKPVFLERKFRLRLGEITLVGSLDRVDRDADGHYEIIDYKTGGEKEQKEVDRSEQLAIYALAAKEDLKIEPTRMSLYFIEGNKKVSTIPQWEKLSEKREQILESVAAIRESHFPAKVSPLCQSCEYRQVCPAYKLTLRR